MTAAESGQVRREYGMVGPPYLYNGAQVCGWRASRTCIFLLATFGVAFIMIGLVLFTGDLRMKSWMWVTGIVFIPIGVVMLISFLVLCCSARRTFQMLPASHPARTKPSRAVLAPPRTPSTYPLLPMTPLRTHVAPAPHVTATHTLPLPGPQKMSRAVEPDGYPTWGYSWGVRRDMADQQRVHAAVDPWGYPSGHVQDYHGMQGFPPDCTMTEYDRHPLMSHTLGRPSPGLQRGSYGAGHMMTLPTTLASPGTQKVDDSPPPYHSVVPGQ